MADAALWYHQMRGNPEDKPESDLGTYFKNSFLLINLMWERGFKVLSGRESPGPGTSGLPVSARLLS